MDNVAEKKGFWITLIVLLVLLVAGLIFALVMTAKYGEPGEDMRSQDESDEDVEGVRVNNDFITFCNDDGLYALDANYDSNPIVTVTINEGEAVRVIDDEAVINDIWIATKGMMIGGQSSVTVSQPQYLITLHRAMGSDIVLVLQSPELLTYDGNNYEIVDDAGLSSII